MRTLVLLALALLAPGCAGGTDAASTPPMSEESARAVAENVLEAAADDLEATLNAMEEADKAAAVAEATAFMAAYARDLLTGNRAAIAARYDRRGAWLLGDGEKRFATWAELEARYAGPRWQPPASFEWRDLSYEPAGRDAVVVAGTFAWGPGEGRAPVILSYTGFLVRQDGELRIRLEDESR